MTITLPRRAAASTGAAAAPIGGVEKYTTVGAFSDSTTVLSRQLFAAILGL